MKNPIGEKVVVQGWVRSKRSFKDFSFVVVNDGSNLNGIQVVFRSRPNRQCIIPSSSVPDITTGCSVQLEGVLQQAASAKHKDGVELRVSSYSVIGGCDQECYPMQKKASFGESSHG